MGKTKRDQKRRDKKGRILRNGESQRKDGRYAFVYTDCYGKQKFLYSWKLEPTDSLPTGCRPCLALREKEKNIQRDLHDGIVPYGGNLTVLDLVQKYIGQKKGVRHNTQANYDFVINIIKKEEFGTRRIDTEKVQVQIPAKKLKQYFPESYSKAQIEEVIFMLLASWAEKQ